MKSLYQKDILKKFLKSENSKNKPKITELILAMIVLSSLPIIVMGGVAMGNAIQIFRVFDKKSRYTDKQIRDGLRGLKRNGFIAYSKNNFNVHLTDKGKYKLESFCIDALKIDVQKNWDRKWRVVMFDLPINYRKIRESFRIKIKQIGFIQLQKSVWVYPFPCTEELFFLSQYYKVEKYVEILVVEKIFNDQRLLKYFNLK